MLHYVGGLVANCGRLMFGAERGAYSGFLELFSNQNSWGAENQNNEQKDAKMLRRAEGK